MQQQEQQQQQQQQREDEEEQQQQQQRRRRRWRLGGRPPSVLSRLRTRVQDSACRAAYTLSDWGLIPRMDVIPLERFEAAFPLTEAPRLQPLYIEKATLPDILDPVLQARFPWLNTSGSSSSGSGSGRLQLQSTAADGGTSDESSDVNEKPGGLLRAFVQPVEIVEPTFRQLLVLYRRKPRVGRWKAVRERLTGKTDSAPATKREVIQLQVGDVVDGGVSGGCFCQGWRQQ
jgi:hypothetical protein